MIREALGTDIPRIVELGSRSLVDGPYKDLLKDTPEQSARLALQVIQNSNGKVLLLENDEGKVVGLLAFIIFPHYFTGELTAGELIWYVVPEERPGCGALKLLWAAEKLAKQMKATRMQFTAPTAEVGAIYKRFGYEQVEVTFQKSLESH